MKISQKTLDTITASLLIHRFENHESYKNGYTDTALGLQLENEIKEALDEISKIEVK